MPERAASLPARHAGHLGPSALCCLTVSGHRGYASFQDKSMSLKAVLDSLEGLDDATKSLDRPVTDGDLAGKFMLDAEPVSGFSLGDDRFRNEFFRKLFFECPSPTSWPDTDQLERHCGCLPMSATSPHIAKGRS